MQVIQESHLEKKNLDSKEAWLCHMLVFDL